MKTFILYDTFLLDGFYVTQNYLARPSYYSQFGLLGHEGVDFGHTNKKTMVRSPLNGTAFVGFDNAYGWFTVIEDYKQGCGVYICHTLEPVVNNGEKVKAGDIIAEMDDTGNSEGEHVHLNFIILDNNGNKKYKAKQQNLGFLDPRYPRDIGDPISFPLVEEYEIIWKTSIINIPPNGGNMPETITVNKSDWDRLRTASEKGDKLINDLELSGNIADKSNQELIDLANRWKQERTDKENNEQNTKESYKKLAISLKMSETASFELIENEVKRLVSQTDTPNPPTGTIDEQVLGADSNYRVDAIIIKRK